MLQQRITELWQSDVVLRADFESVKPYLGEYQSYSLTGNGTAHLKREYLSQCVNSDTIDDTLIISCPIDYYHSTVYTYDRAGNLVRTAPPRGINLYSTAIRVPTIRNIHRQ